jgi:DNA (cytosine-5)-methyltransferase 1
MERNPLYSFVDLFSGAGGMSYGFKAHPAFLPRFAVDAERGKPSSDSSIECNGTYELNIGIPVHGADLAEYSPEDLLRDSGLRRGDLDVLIACAPCTGFSRTLRKNHLEDDPRNHLVERMGLFVEVLRPRIFTMENARELIKGNFSYHSASLAEHLIRLGYSFSGEIHMLSEFGLPQHRERSIIIATRDGARIRTLHDLWRGYKVRAEGVTVRRAISHLPRVAAGALHPSDPLHVSPRFSADTTLDRLMAIPPDGGSWFDLLKHPDADRLLIPSMKRTVAAGDFGSHPDVYGRLWWDRPAVTIKRECGHVGNGRYSHPEQHRLCTVREIALLNGFPAHYAFVSRSLTNKYRQVGDAVPPLISYQIAHICHWILSGRRPELAECVLGDTSLRVDDLCEVRVDQPGLFDAMDCCAWLNPRPRHRWR